MNPHRFVITAALLIAVIASVCATVYAPTPSDATTIFEASEAAIVLNAPEKAKVGQLVVLDVGESIANTFKWQLQNPSSNFLVIDNGRRAVFSAEAGGDYTFVIAAAKDNSVDVKIHTIKVVDGPSVLDFATKVANWCEPVVSATKRDDAIKLAQSFSSVSAVINAQMTPADIVEATKKSNRDALGENIQNWVPFLEKLQAELKVQAEAGKLPDNEAHRRIWRAIADGLNEYAETL